MTVPPAPACSRALRPRCPHGRAVAAARVAAGVAAAALSASAAAAQAPGPAADTGVRVTVGGFVDTYVAYDAGRPRALDRVYTTQAARHAEFNVNLAHVELAVAAPRVRGRFAAQFGTAVQANYAGEPRVGAVSGPDVSRFVQEATAGYRVARSVWVDAGVYFSPFGGESWISRDNWTYTRSLIADGSPYYAAGVKATWAATPRLTAQLHVLNGWQNVSETNADKALGARVDYAPHPRVALAYDAFVGNEQPDGAERRVRVFQEGAVRLTVTERLRVSGTFDYGVQPRAGGAGAAAWRGFAVVGQYRVAPRVALGGRVERYSDPEQVVFPTGLAAGLRASGASANVDVAPHPRLLWRTELRGLAGPDAIFPARGADGALSRRTAGAVTSLALTL